MKNKRGNEMEYGTRLENCEECKYHGNCKEDREDCILEVTLEEPLVTSHPNLFG